METITNKPACTMLSTAVTAGQHGHITVPSVTHPQCRYDIQQQLTKGKKKAGGLVKFGSTFFSSQPQIPFFYILLLFCGETLSNENKPFLSQ